MLVPLYLLGVFKAWVEQMPWDTLPSRVMDVYEHLHARCGATSFLLAFQLFPLLDILLLSEP
eukprot:4526735-Amphidinium_carterae.1